MYMSEKANLRQLAAFSMDRRAWSTDLFLESLHDMACREVLSFVKE